MKGWFQTLVLAASLAGRVVANESEIKQDDAHRQRCSGMYSRKAWGGDIDPFILTKFLKVEDDTTDQDILVSLVIFEWGDEELIGRPIPGNPDEIATICDQVKVDAGLCSQEELGSFILAENATEASKLPILSKAINLKDPAAINYPVKKTGFYCVSTYAFSGHDYQGVVEFRNAYGELPAAQIAKLPFYGGLTIVYAVFGVFWAFLYVQNRHDILPVQNYITAILIFLVVEEAITWGFYDYQNSHGSNAFAKVLMIIVAILNAGRNAFSFFLLLIVCMGYGVVKPSLGRTMIWVRVLAITHFVFSVIYGIASLTITPDSAGPLVLLVILPLAATLTAFYVWTLNSLNMTMKDLVERKQKTKAMMYKKLWWCILGSIIVIFAFFFINSFAFAGRSAANFVPDHWKTRWFVLDGWLNLVYLFDIAFISYLWRPTANNRRFAMSDELAQDDDGFEIRSLANSLDEEGAMPLNDEYERYSPERELSPVPPKPVQPAPQQRESLDGETIFAVGEEDGDKFSDDDDDDDFRKSSEETRKLTGGSHS
ncbi:integral membrane protein (Ptm1), putative [Talaromyces stipitatus ATCC 10500]|uniref:Integral membrane protein (Ptm1), putative n=1 Tax=Talaromyces stipitatus (strain ATCC 10500 / CBS 375.48 / QM 6759 / NRRL 1006) TaxID=441959 RepID=B8M1L9_TALSN|nr:integral membrane protein (Ptm1), putative [Talaromyces stipitatus ATCC 10500]EED22106.1 integral membrane protein (Ptm1), putative [Talaromyces stipitatus ATCC 10500]